MKGVSREELIEFAVKNNAVCNKLMEILENYRNLRRQVETEIKKHTLETETLLNDFENSFKDLILSLFIL